MGQLSQNVGNNCRERRNFHSPLTYPTIPLGVDYDAQGDHRQLDRRLELAAGTLIQ